MIDGYQHERGGGVAVEDARVVNAAEELDHRVGPRGRSEFLGQAGDGQRDEGGQHDRVLDALAQGEPAMIRIRRAHGQAAPFPRLNNRRKMSLATKMDMPPTTVGMKMR